MTTNVTQAQLDTAQKSINSGEVYVLNEKGEDIKTIQQTLIDLGHKDVKVTGEYDVTTKEAVEAEQKEAGLKSDGKVGKDTFKALDEKIDAQRAAEKEAADLAEKEKNKKANEEKEKKPSAWDNFQKDNPMLAMVLNLVTGGKAEGLINGDINFKDAFKPTPPTPEQVATKELNALANFDLVQNIDLNPSTKELDKVNRKINRLEKIENRRDGQDERLEKLYVKRDSIQNSLENNMLEQLVDTQLDLDEAQIKLEALKEKYGDNKKFKKLLDSAENNLGQQRTDLGLKTEQLSTEVAKRQLELADNQKSYTEDNYKKATLEGKELSGKQEILDVAGVYKEDTKNYSEKETELLKKTLDNVMSDGVVSKEEQLLLNVQKKYSGLPTEDIEIIENLSELTGIAADIDKNINSYTKNEQNIMKDIVGKAISDGIIDTQELKDIKATRDILSKDGDNVGDLGDLTPPSEGKNNNVAKLERA